MDNLLRNGDFTQGTHRLVEGGHEVSEVEIPTGWTFEYAPMTAPGVMHRPECKPAIIFGMPVWKAFSTFSTHQYTLSQIVPVVAGRTYRLTAEVRCWSSMQDDGSVSQGDGIDPKTQADLGYLASIGIGYADGQPIWGDVDSRLDQVIDLSMIFTAQYGEVKVLLRGEAIWGVKHNDAYWAGAVLEPISGGDVLSLEERVVRLEEWARSAITTTGQARHLSLSAGVTCSR